MLNVFRNNTDRSSIFGFALPWRPGPGFGLGHWYHKEHLLKLLRIDGKVGGEAGTSWDQVPGTN